MLNALIQPFEGTLVEAIQNLFTNDHTVKEEPEKYPSVASMPLPIVESYNVAFWFLNTSAFPFARHFGA
ncbi:MAG TPA: hypothetical protein VK077_06725 [Virgibacillus sp.]|nr:hypothetical protein [Virgibacillus sp.]